MITVKIDEQLKTLDKLMARAEASLQKRPKGYVNAVRSNGRFQYYFKESASERHGKYMPKADLPLAAALVQKDYDKSFLAAAEEEKRKLLKMKEEGTERSISFLYAALSDVYGQAVEGRRKLIKPYVLPDEQFIKEWKDVKYQGLSFSGDMPEFFSGCGERVRSKSEILIADKLNALGIPYRYEYPLYLGRQNPVYPDFTILDTRERKMVVYEHFGMMQDEKYARDAMNKIKDYEKAGYLIGENFLFTMESSDCPLDMRVFERRMRARFLE